MASELSLDKRGMIEDMEKCDDDMTLFHESGIRRKWKAWLWRLAIAFLSLGWMIPLLQSREDAVIIYGKPDHSPLPPEVFQRVKKTFYPDDRYVGLSNETHHHWDHLVAGHDALYVANPDDYGLPKGIHPPFDHPGKVHGGPTNFYVISLLHQLHCLNIIRYHYVQVKTGAPMVGTYSEAAWDVHMDHCFEYLRQGISCGSAFEIEGSSPLDVPGETGHHASTVTGWGIEHDCINFEAMRAFQINQEREYNVTWQGLL